MAALGMTAMYLLMAPPAPFPTPRGPARGWTGIGGTLHQLRHGGAVAGILVPQLYQRLIVVLAYPVPDVDGGGHIPVLQGLILGLEGRPVGRYSGSRPS